MKEFPVETIIHTMQNSVENYDFNKHYANQSTLNTQQQLS